METHGPAVRAIASEFMARYKGTSEPDEFALSAAEAGLLAALPHIAPRPVIDRAAARRAIYTALFGSTEGTFDNVEVALDAVMALARPMPTREQIARAAEAEMLAAYPQSARLAADAAMVIAPGVLALLNGSES